MKSFSKTSFILSFACMGFVLAMGATPLARADESVAAAPAAAGAEAQPRHHHHHGRKSFRVGMCVGQALAAQGIVLPPHVPGQRPAPNAATKAAFQSAMQSCHAQFKRPSQPAAPSST
jgi:hypothetical protein